MAELDGLSARLTALETVIGQLVTHLAVRADDPPRWVATRRALALRATDARPADEAASLREAIKGFFDPWEAVAAEYAESRPTGTSPEAPR